MTKLRVVDKGVIISIVVVVSSSSRRPLLIITDVVRSVTAPRDDCAQRTRRATTAVCLHVCKLRRRRCTHATGGIRSLSRQPRRCSTPLRCTPALITADELNCAAANCN